MFQQLRGRIRGLLVAPFSPQLHSLANLIDEAVLFNAILHPLFIQRELLAPFGFLLRLGDRDKVGTDSTTADDLIGDAVVAKLEMPRRLHEW